MAIFYQQQTLKPVLQVVLFPQPKRALFLWKKFQETDFPDTHFINQEIFQLVCFRLAMHIFNSRINIFSILAEYLHINQFRPPDRAGHSSEISYWSVTCIKVKFLTQGNIQGPHTFTDRCSRGPFIPIM